jgi:hypothetical protein
MMPSPRSVDNTPPPGDVWSELAAATARLRAARIRLEERLARLGDEQVRELPLATLGLNDQPAEIPSLTLIRGGRDA